jgi:hypothetical protein
MSSFHGGNDMLRLQMLLFCALATAGHGAEIFRCTGPDGEPLYTQIPCDAPTRIVRPLADRPPAGVPAGIRASERAWLESRERAAPSQPAPDRRRGATAGTAEPSPDAYACRQKQRALDAVKLRLRRGYRPGQGERLRRQRASHEDYIAVFCRS